MLPSDSQRFIKKEKKSIPSALSILENCKPVMAHPIGKINISPVGKWIVTHSKHCLGHDDIVSAISIGGDDRIDRDLSVAVVKGYVHALSESKSLDCSYEVITIPSLNQESDGVISYMYPFVLSCDDPE